MKSILYVVQAYCFVLLFSIAASEFKNESCANPANSNLTHYPDDPVERLQFYKNIICLMYKNSVKKTVPILRKIDMLSNVDGSSAYNYRVLFERMQINDDLYSTELMMLMHRLHFRGLMNMSDPHYKYIHDNLPENVRDFPWQEDQIIIKSSSTNERLCISRENIIPSKVSVYPVVKKKLGRYCVWNIRVDEEYPHIGVTLSDSTNLSDVLYAGDNEELLDSKRRVIFAGNDDEFSKNYFGGNLWEFEPLRNGNFRIYNIFYDEYLFIETNDEHKPDQQALLYKSGGCHQYSDCEFSILKKSKKCNSVDLDFTDLKETDGSDRIQDIICGAYQKSVINTWSILDWIENKIENKNQKLIAYHALFVEMENNDDLYTKELMMLVYHLHIQSLLDPSESDHIKYISMRLPSIVRNFPWNSTIVLYNSDLFCLDTSLSSVSNSKKYEMNCGWKIHKANSSYSLGFRLNSYSNQDLFLYAGDNTELNDSERRKVMVSNEIEFLDNYYGGDLWMFEPLQNEKWRIFNIYYREFMSLFQKDRFSLMLSKRYGCDNEYDPCEFDIDNSDKMNIPYY